MADTGASFGSFGGGFAKGLANVLYRNQQQAREDARLKQERQDRLMQSVLPHVFANMEDPADAEGVLQGMFPDVFGAVGKSGTASNPKKVGSGKSPGAMESVSNVLGFFKPHLLPGSSGPGTQQSTLPTQPTGMMASGAGEQTSTGGTAGTPILAQPINQPPDLPMPPASTIVAPGIPAVTAQPPATDGTGAPTQRHTLFGVPMMTREESEEAKTGVPARVRIARKLAAQGIPLDQAMDYAGLYNSNPGRGGAAAARALRGKDASGKPVMAVFNPAKKAFEYAEGEKDDQGNDVAGQPIPGFIQETSTQARGTAGAIATQAAIALGYDTVADATAAGKHKELSAKIEELLQAQATARAKGTGQGKFESPIDVKTAQETNTNVGASSADYAGQQVPNAQEADRARSLQTLKAGIQHVLTSGMLKVLPTKGVTGAVPGATIALRRRLNSPSGMTDAQGQPISYRAAMAQLDSEISNMVNTLARVAGEQRGTQTEKDAERAYQGLVDLQGALSDPLRGDTLESATVRLNEAIKVLDRIAGGLQAAPVPNPKPGAAGTPKAGAAAAGAKGPDPANPKAPWQDAQGNWHIP